MPTNFEETLQQLLSEKVKPDGKKYTIEEISSATEISSIYIRKLLSGESKPGFDVVEKLAHFFDVDPNFLHGWNEKQDQKNINPQIETLIQKVAFRKSSLTSDSAEEVAAMLREIAKFIAGETNQ